MWHNGFNHWNAMGGGWGGGGWGGSDWSWFAGFHGILWILFLALIVFGIVHLIREGRRNPARDAALTTLGQEYASGRIDREEFLRRKQDLT